MALGYLFILFIVFAVVSLLSITLLYVLKKENLKTFVFYFLCIWSIYLAYVNFTSFPTNFIASRLISCLFGLLAIVAAIINITNKSKINLSYVLVSASTLLTLIDMFFI